MCPIMSACHSDSQHVTPLSLTHNAVTWTPGMFATISARLMQNASLEERITQMEEFICMLSSTSANDQTSKDQIVSTWQAATLTSKYLREGLGLATTMRSKMVMWSQEDSHDQKKTRPKRSHHETLRGRLLSQLRSLQRSFGKTALHLHQTNLFGATIPPKLSTTLHSRWKKTHTRHHKAWSSALKHTLSLINGLETGWLDIREEVSYLARRVGASPRRSAPLRYKRKGTPAHTLKGASSYL